MKKAILIILILSLSGCAAIAQKEVWNPEKAKVSRSWLPPFRKQISLGDWVPVEKYKCRGAGCEVEFSTKGKLKGGTIMPTLPPLKLENN